MRKTRTLVLENDPVDLVPKEVHRVLAHPMFRGFEIWADFRYALSKENVADTMRRLHELKSGDHLVMRHVFAGYYQMEKMILLLEQLAQAHIQLNLWMVGADLTWEFNNYLRRYESEITPPRIHSVDGRARFKRQMNKRLLAMLEFHIVRKTYYFGLNEVVWADWMAQQERVTPGTLKAAREKEKRKCTHNGRERTKGGAWKCSSCGKKLED